MAMCFTVRKMEAKAPMLRAMEWELSKHLVPPFIRRTTSLISFQLRKMKRSIKIRLDSLKGTKLVIKLENRIEFYMRRMAMWCLRQCLLKKAIKKNKVWITGLDKHSQCQDKVMEETTCRTVHNPWYSRELMQIRELVNLLIAVLQ